MGYDENEDGVISDVEVAGVMEDLGIDASKDQLAQAVAQADTDGDGVVTKDEFHAIYSIIGGATSDDLSEADAFGAYDGNGDGTITQSEFTDALNAKGYDASNQDSDKLMFESVDANGDGIVDRAEFDFIYNNIMNGAVKKRKLDEASAFTGYDRNQDGEISLFETAAVIGEIGLAPDEDDVKQAMANADTNGDGVVSKDEFHVVFAAVAAL